MVLLVTFFVEKFSQAALKAVVDRGHPPTAHGSFPSGGCARLITVFGIIFYLALLTWPAISRRWRVTGWTVIAALAFIEGFDPALPLQALDDRRARRLAATARCCCSR